MEQKKDKPYGKVLVVDDNEDVLFALNMILKPHVEAVRVTTQPARVEHYITTFCPDVVLLDMNFTIDTVEGEEGFELLQHILTLEPQTSVIMMTAYGDTEKAVRAIRQGAVDFICKPWENDKLLASLLAAIRLKQSRQEVFRMKEHISMLSPHTSDIIGQSPAMQRVFAMIEQVRNTDANVLILGENGTGKDLVANALANPSLERGAPYVCVDLGSIPETLFESELFGYEKGAFTDARQAKAGRMELADGGTLFLDEIGNLSPAMQSKLLTAIEKKQIMRVGSTHSRSIEMRLICATNADIRRMVREGTFRQDLLYRINTVEIHIPPLREREGDVKLLAHFFLKQFSDKYKKNIDNFSEKAIHKLQMYNWPGNVRELQHTIERAVILCNTSTIESANLMLLPVNEVQEITDKLPTLNLDELERRAVSEAMKNAKGNPQQAAELLGISRYAIYRKLEKHHL